MTVVIASYKGSPFLQGAIDSVPSTMKCIVVRNGGYEAGALRWCQANMNEDFFFMQDSARIKDPKFLMEMEPNKSYCVNNETGIYSMYTGLIRISVLRRIAIPETKTKMDAVLYEMSFGNNYAMFDGNVIVLWPELTFENARNEVIFDRPVKVYENEYFLKYKTCHGGHLIQECCERDQIIRAANP